MIPYSRAQLEQARRRQERIAASTGIRSHLKEGRMTMRIDPVLFHNARIANQEDYGVDNIWREPEFCRDMCRRHPEIAVKSRGKIRVSDFGVRCSDEEGKLTRFGRVTFHKSY